MHSLGHRHFIAAIVLLVFIPVVAFAVPGKTTPAGEETPAFIQRMLDNPNDPIHYGCAHAKAGLVNGGYAEIADDTLHTYDSQHLDIMLWPDINSGSFDADVTITAVANESLSEFVFNLWQCDINSLTVDGIPATYSYQSQIHPDDAVVVTPAQTIAAGDTFDINVQYTGTIRSNNFVGGMIWASSTQTLFTFGEPYETRRWLACYDLPFDKVTSRMRVAIDTTFDVLSNGVLASVEDQGDGTHIYDWQNNEPTSTYLISIAAADYVIVEDGPAGINDVPVAYWVLPQWQDEAVYDFERTDDMIDYFEPLFGVYPFVKYDQAQTSIFNGWGAMEHQTCTTFGHNLSNTGNRNFENIVAHELGHMWWGDLVGPRTFANIWLNEGFASYSEAIWAENFGWSSLTTLMSVWRTQYFQEHATDPHALYDPSLDNMFSTTIYKKGGWVLHMLRFVIGDAAFYTGLQNYAAAHAYETATVPEFKAAMEAASGQDLTEFFDQWVYQPGYPQYQFSQFDVVEEGDGWTASLRLQQTQNNAPLFSTPLPFRFSGDGQDTTMRADVLAQADQTLVFTGLEFAPDTFLFDPDQWILCTDNYNSVEPPDPVQPLQFELSQAWPNPFNAQASFQVQLTRNGHLTARVYDMLGREVANLVDETLRAGIHRFSWDPASNVSSGTYLLRVQSETLTETRKLTLIR